MGIFDFVKEAGAKVGIGDGPDDDKEEKGSVGAAAAAAAAAKASTDARAEEVRQRIKDRKAQAANAQRMERRADARQARGLEKYVRDLGFDVEGLDIRFDDGKAEVSGKVADQETRERVILAIGNTQEVEQVEDDIEISGTAAAESNMHVVVSGDTLSKIAKEYYGDAGKYPVIFEANKPMLSNPDLIFPGQVLRIPAQ